MSGSSQQASSRLDHDIEHLLSKMTIEEKVGQMTQVTLQVVSKTRGTPEQKYGVDLDKLRKAILEYHLGSILHVYDVALTLDEWRTLIKQIQDIATKETRLGIPVIYGIDAIHGAGFIREATLFPQSIAMAATRNPELVRKSAEITAREMLAAGIPWNFNPVLDVGRSQLWPRLWETFGEDSLLVSKIGLAYVQGLQGQDNNHSVVKAAACAKHYVGYSYPLSGKDRTPAWIPERMLRDYFLPPFEDAVNAGILTVMANSGEINGIPVHSDYNLLTKLLKEELGFRGFIVSDWEDVIRLYTRDKVAASPEDAVKMAVMAGIDMSMVPFDYSFYNILLKLARDREVPQWRIDDAVGRILHVKFALNLFQNPYGAKSNKARVSSLESSNLSLQAAREAITLLKNDDSLLPLKREARVLVTGPNAHLRSVLNGGWSYTSEGKEEALYPRNKMTILEAIQSKAGKENVTFVEGALHETTANMDAAAEASKAVDVAIVCLGEEPYCETPGNIHDLTLPRAQYDLVKAILRVGTPVVLVLIEGRPRVITPLVDQAKSVLLAYLPGPEGGQAIADVLFGDYTPCGRLPYTYPRQPNDLVCHDHKPIEMDTRNKLNPLWEFGHGLSYTTFSYSKLKLSKKTMRPNGSLSVSAVVKNTGQRTARHVVELYVSDLVRSVSPQIRQLKGFRSVFLRPNEREAVHFTIKESDLSFHNRENKRVTEPGQFRVLVGDLSATFALEN